MIFFTEIVISAIIIIYCIINLAVILTILFETDAEMSKQFENLHVTWFKINNQTVGNILLRFVILFPTAIILLIKRIMLMKVIIHKNDEIMK